MRENKIGNTKKIFEKWGIGLVLLVMIGVFGILGRNFFSVANMFNIMSQVSLVGIASCGMMLVLLIGEIDLSMGGQITWVNVFMAYMVIKQGFPIWLAAVIIGIYAVIQGTIVGLLITKIKIPSFIVTMAFMKILQGGAYLLCGGMPIYGFPPNFRWLGQGRIFQIPVATLVMVICFVIVGIILNYSFFGRHLVAIGNNDEVAKLSGINVDKSKTIVYIISTLFGCLSGIVTLSRLNSGAPQTGDGFEFNVIIACVIGGVSLSGGVATVVGCVMGVFIMGILINGMALMNLDSYVQRVVTGVVLLCAVAFDCIQKSRAAKLNKAEEARIMQEMQSKTKIGNEAE